ncbi:MAG: hypothetical protein FJZ10_02860 [Candidatus Omnitrophica bacterium]|nr:hypothetical protein [Candidatus Omnitrophota bacterium]
MKEFLIGLIFIVAVFVLAGIGVLLMPFWLLLAIALRIALIVIFVCFCIWLLGKLIVLIWEKIKAKQ